MSHLLHGSGSNHNGHWNFESQHSCWHVDLTHINKNAGTEPVPMKVSNCQTISFNIALKRKTEERTRTQIEASLKKIQSCFNWNLFFKIIFKENKILIKCLLQWQYLVSSNFSKLLLTIMKIVKSASIETTSIFHAFKSVHKTHALG